MPYAQNDGFVGRESQLGELAGKLFVNGCAARVAITGPGGVGKTQLALALAYQIRQDYKDCSVFWISVGNAESIHQAFTNIAQRLNITGWNDDKAEIKRLVQLHLSNDSTGQWLLIFDNADEAALAASGLPKADDLIDFLPSSKLGAIVFTTLDKTIAEKLAPHSVIELQRMDDNTAQRMLEACSVNPTNERTEASSLLHELAHLPLAIMLAAAYIRENKITIADYLALLAAQDKKSVARISEGFDDEWQSGGTRNAVATAWLISFERIRSTFGVAASHLCFMACIDQRDIPISILPISSTHSNKQENEVDARVDAVEAVKALEAYCFITKRPHESALDLHRLVHLLTCNWLQTQNQRGQQVQAAIEQLTRVFPDDNPNHRSKWRRLLPHAIHALSSEVAGQEEEMPKAKLLWKCANALISDGRYTEAAMFYQEVLQDETRLLGAEHPSTLASMANLASTYRNQGRWKEAEELEVQVMETSKRVLGDEHPDTLTSMANLASTYRNQGRWKEAEELEVQVIETSKRVLGDEHPDTLTSMANLASTFWSQGRWKEAEELEVQVLETRKRVLGDEHPDTLTSMANLASTYEESRAVEGGGRAGGASDGDVQEGAWGRAS